MYDVVIVGGGPAGLTTAIYTTRRTLKTVIIAKDLGGQMALTSEIENYPGVNLIDGVSLAMKMKEQAMKFGAEYISSEVTKIKKVNNHFLISTPQQEFTSRSIILAFGLTPRNLDVPGEDKFKGRGVSYCVNCDGPFFKNKIVAIVGGGNAALDGAEYLSRLASKTYLIHRRSEFRGDQATLEKIKKEKRVEMILDSVIKEIKGEEKVQSIIIENLKSKEQKEMKVDGVFVEIGRLAKTDFLQGLLELNEKGEIKIDRENRTNVPGIFAAGDITSVYSKQIIISAGEGAKAALACYSYLNKLELAGADWGKR